MNLFDCRLLTVKLFFSGADIVFRYCPADHLGLQQTPGCVAIITKTQAGMYFYLAHMVAYIRFTVEF